MSHELDTERLTQNTLGDIGEFMKAIGARSWKVLSSCTLSMTTKAEKQLLEDADNGKTQLPEHYMVTEIDANKGKITASDARRFRNWESWLEEKGFKQESV
jgi:hypothetical protein